MSLEGAPLLARGRIPDLDLTRGITGHQGAAVVRIAYAEDVVGMGERVYQLSGGRVPDPRRLVGAAGGERFSAGRERHRCYRSPVIENRADLFGRAGVPDLDEMI